MEVRIIELLSGNLDHAPHAWVDVITQDGDVLTVRIDVRETGFRVYLRSNDDVGEDQFIEFGPKEA